MKVDNRKDKQNYKQYIFTVKHIDTELERLDRPSIKDLTLMDGLEYTIKTMPTHRWINQGILGDLWCVDHLFTIFMLLLADFLNSDPMDISTYDTSIWSDEAKCDTTKTGKVIEFMGNVATIIYVPESEAQMAKLTPTFNVMWEFYTSIVNSQSKESGDSKYQGELGSSLSRLKNRKDTINEWKSYCEAMESYYQLNIQPK
ncbi:hypothetical protein F4813DRAFT_388939 [Daldinia decipiens]|uniref:uncharacterized protein n=1 Tax=Daldinia decipiens TaxID=326647 RepID=UPI0020C20881|nr:uncharacterized protein F4813DRAFT_388939 [Daldinia decipiens]KAI1658159.1 hypothetical protein F4813DRAFT_388939 [Daldinia decipiens]